VPLSVVWFKRDLRTTDHAPLMNAITQCVQNGDELLLVYLFEPEMLAHPTTSSRHLCFQWQAIQGLNQRLVSQGLSLKIHPLQASAADVFKWLHSQHQLQFLFSHEETGLRYTYERDLNVKNWCARNDVVWNETPQLGVIRGLQNRKRWSYRWHANMRKPPIKVDFNPWLKAGLLPCIPEWPSPWKMTAPPKPTHEHDVLGKGPFQMGGEEQAQQLLTSFIKDGRIENYQKHISKPEESRQSCSRLSPYLAWGQLSMRQVFQALEACESKTMAHRAFGSRLRWHCHFIQKFESEHRIETENMNRGFDDMTVVTNGDNLLRWMNGDTGIPFIDACMRCVRETGYLNFRMRAMLVSFLTHHMGHSWKDGVNHLARCFLDFEPGIHFCQFQMQAGVTGINTLRIYNPVKQGLDHDPDGLFIRKWVPSLQEVPLAFVHEPWRMPPLELAMQGGDTRSVAPMIDIKATARQARSRLWTFKNHPAVRAEAQRILNVHVDTRYQRRRRP